MIFASGSGRLASAPGQIGMQILIDNIVQGHAWSYVNENASHHTFASNALVVSNIGAGLHQLQLAPLLTPNNTYWDEFDYFNVTVLELPITASTAPPPPSNLTSGTNVNLGGGNARVGTGRTLEKP